VFEAARRAHAQALGKQLDSRSIPEGDDAPGSVDLEANSRRRKLEGRVDRDPVDDDFERQLRASTAQVARVLAGGVEEASPCFGVFSLAFQHELGSGGHLWAAPFGVWRVRLETDLPADARRCIRAGIGASVGADAWARADRNRGGLEA